ncbi:mercuric transporter MerT family protein [Aestuariispira insulae]|uniref:Mercuric transport protein MerT n=1 Tax=Aestuariispira insulae TaxID=1461337 RepID=A0A3D9H1G3_9PROT|nr:mercuric transporter MerT family protein [Aestuariispira insulae]RED43335.1 mercuric ion transport protein [Aestuariispira insulae]
MATSQDMETQSTAESFSGGKGMLAAGGIIGATLSASCCVLPLVLFSVGVTGSWIGNLTALAPYQPYFVGMALLFLGAGYWRAYRKPKAACEGGYCASTRSDHVVKAMLWLATLLVALAAAFPYTAPYLLGE